MKYICAYEMKYRVKSNFKVLLEKRNIRTKVALSEKIKISRPTLDKIEEGDIDSLKFGLLKKVLEEFNCTFDQLFTLIPMEDEVDPEEVE